jgi:hypothetical protein
MSDFTRLRERTLELVPDERRELAAAAWCN